MKAVQVESYGGKEVLTINESATKPQLKDGKILVRVRAASLNPFDIALLSGIYKEMMPLSFPTTPGGDFSGVIEKVGLDATGFRVGDEVFGTAMTLSGGSGAFAQFALANAENVAQKPSTASFTEAAALPLVGSSAVQALEEHIHVEPKQKILIHGGAGGIGHIAIQLAKALGAYVATTANADDFEFVKKMGADEAIDYKTQAFEQILSGYDAVYDTVGGDITIRSFQVLKKGGTLVSMKGQPDMTLASQHGVKAIGQNTKTNTPHLQRVAQLVDEGKLNVHVDTIYAFEDAPRAWEHQQSGHPRGKIVLTIENVRLASEH